MGTSSAPDKKGIAKSSTRDKQRRHQPKSLVGFQVMVNVQSLGKAGKRTRVGWPGELVSLNDQGFVVLRQPHSTIYLPHHVILDITPQMPLRKTWSP